MRWIISIIINIVLIFPEAVAWQWISDLIMNPYGMHGLAYGTCIGISIAVGAIVFLYKIGNLIDEALNG
jgi:ammonia channel protein AmtB